MNNDELRASLGAIDDHPTPEPPSLIQIQSQASRDHRRRVRRQVLAAATTFIALGCGGATWVLHTTQPGPSGRTSAAQADPVLTRTSALPPLARPAQSPLAHGQPVANDLRPACSSNRQITVTKKQAGVKATAAKTFGTVRAKVDQPIEFSADIQPYGPMNYSIEDAQLQLLSPHTPIGTEPEPALVEGPKAMKLNHSGHVVLSFTPRAHAQYAVVLRTTELVTCWGVTHEYVTAMQVGTLQTETTMPTPEPAHRS